MPKRRGRDNLPAEGNTPVQPASKKKFKRMQNNFDVCRSQTPVYSGICGVVGRATACYCGVVGLIPTGGALEVWPWTFGFRTAWLINKSAGLPPLR